MRVLITRASDDYWYKIAEVGNIKTLYNEIGSFIVRPNYNTDIDDLMQFWDKMKIEDAKEIVEMDFYIEIYDDYVE